MVLGNSRFIPSDGAACNPMSPASILSSSFNHHIEDDCFHCIVIDNLHILKMFMCTTCFFLNYILFFHSDDDQAAQLVSGVWFLMCFVKNELTLT